MDISNDYNAATGRQRLGGNTRRRTPYVHSESEETDSRCLLVATEGTDVAGNQHHGRIRRRRATHYPRRHVGRSPSLPAALNYLAVNLFVDRSSSAAARRLLRDQTCFLRYTSYVPGLPTRPS